MSTERREKSVFRSRARLMLAYAGTLAFFAVVLFAALPDLMRYFKAPPQLVLTLSAAFGFSAFLILLMLYLRGSISFPGVERFITPEEREKGFASDFRSLRRQQTELSTLYQDMQGQISDLQARIAATPPNAFEAPLGSERVLDSLRQHVTQTLATEIEARLEERIRKSLYSVTAAHTFEGASIRLRSEIDSLSRRANVNLVIGVATTSVAVALLVYMTLNAKITFDNWPDLLSHYIPRLTTAVFIEVFSFFFLRLYSASLAEIRYYQNELTTLDSKKVALDAAKDVDNADARTAVIAAIGNTERNHNTRSQSTQKKDIKEIADLLEHFAKIASSVVRRSSYEKEND